MIKSVGLSKNVFTYEVKIQCKVHEHINKPCGLYGVYSLTYTPKGKKKTCVNGGRTVQNKVYFLIRISKKTTTTKNKRGKTKSTHKGVD